MPTTGPSTSDEPTPDEPNPDTPPGHLSPDEFRALGHRMVDRIADYWRTIEDRPVNPPTEPGEVEAALPAHAPEHPEPWDAIFDDLGRIVEPNLTHWQHPGFFAFFPANASFPAILGELACAGLGAQGMLWSTGPACTELETRVLDWMADLLDLPPAFRSDAPHHQRGGGVIQGTASESTLVSLVAARSRLRDRGIDGPLAIYTSDQAHSSVTKAAMIAGLARTPDDHASLRVLPTRSDLSLDTDALRAAIVRDLAGGITPAWIGLTAGTTATGAFDDIAAAAQIRGELCPDAWIHVDAAWAGVAAVCPEHRGFHAGLEHAESYVTNAHKGLLTNIDCSLFYTRDRESLNRAMSITPAYLRNEASDAGAVIDYRDWHVELGRRFRALKLWFVIRHYGVQGLRAHIRRHVAWAAELEDALREDDRFEIASPRSLSLITFRVRAGDDATRELHRRLNASGRTSLTLTTVPVGPDRAERAIIRLCVGAPTTERRHVEGVLELIRAEAGRVLDGYGVR